MSSCAQTMIKKRKGRSSGSFMKEKKAKEKKLKKSKVKETKPVTVQDPNRGSVENDVFIPKIKFIYPEETDEQLIKVEKKRRVKLDVKYYNRLTNVIFKIGQFFFKIIFVLIAHPLVRIRYHLKVEGREHLKAHKKRLKKEGFLTVSNHVFLWDYVALCASMRMGLPNVPAWGKIIYSRFGGWFSLAGVVPIPEDKSVFRKFYQFVGDIFKQNKWVHIYPETGLWYYYVPIRPFKRGAAVFAYQYNKPIIPVGYSFRERTGISRWFNKKDPYVTVHICPPVWPDRSKDKPTAVEEMNERIRTSIMHAVGIENEEENKKIMEQYYQYEKGHFYTKL